MWCVRGNDSAPRFTSCKTQRAVWKEMLIIFGNTRARRGAELIVMSTVENKAPGIYTRGLREKTSDTKGFDTERMIFKDDELSYALGKEGSTRKKLELAAGGKLLSTDCMNKVSRCRLTECLEERLSRSRHVVHCSCGP